MPATISICTLLAEQYRTGEYPPGPIRRYFSTLAAYYAGLATSADVRVTLPDDLTDHERAVYAGSMLSLVSLCVEHPAFVRLLGQALPDLVGLLDTLDGAARAGRTVPPPPPHSMSRGPDGRLVVREPEPEPSPVPWERAGGPDECRHGYAAGVPCPTCGPR